MFIVVVVYYIMTQSGNVWIHPRIMSLAKVISSWYRSYSK